MKAAATAFAFAERALSKRSGAAAERLGERMGMLLWRLDRKRRERTLSNLALAFPEWSEARRLEVAHGVFRHFGRTAADFLRSAVRSKEEVLSSIEIEGLEFLDQALEGGKGVILVTAHFGNWERLAHYVTLRGYAISVVARDANQGGVNDRVTALRERTGVSVLSRGSAARQILKELRANRAVGILPDQNADDRFLPFFGKPAGTVMGPAVLSLRAESPILPAFCWQTGPGRFRCRVQPPLAPIEGFEPEEGLMRAVNLAIENQIREVPEQWLWMHDRWKNARRRGLL